jgi:hypothetical protein
VFPSVEHVLADAGRVRDLRRQARQLLDGPAPSEDVPEQTATALVLAQASGLLPGPEDSSRGRRAEALAHRAAATPALGAVLRELRAGLAGTAPLPTLTRGR